MASNSEYEQRRLFSNQFLNECAEKFIESKLNEKEYKYISFSEQDLKDKGIMVGFRTIASSEEYKDYINLDIPFNELKTNK